MELHPISARRSHLGNSLPRLDLLSFPNQQPAVVTVGTDIDVTVFDDDQLAVTPQPTSGVNNRSIRRSHDRLAQLPADINAFIQTTV